jgi:predicted heme/steroid binding protein/uncharacterized membrane protein
MREIFLALVFVILFAFPARATEEYAAKTGLECSACHVNPLGGGELTKRGESFKANLVSSADYRPLGLFKRVVRLMLGYFHILAGVVWFGTIFYVHILLKPAYASKGLPKGELILGWSGIVIVGVTGTLLTYARMHSWESFYATRFGLLLSIKIFLYLFMAGTAALVTFVLGPRMKKRMVAPVNAGGEMTGEMTPDELRAFDGKEGRRALVAVEGVIYDVTDSRLWKNGKHTRHLAGNDLTDSIKQAPHDSVRLLAFPKVGTLLAGHQKGPGGPKAVFYFFAYSNLIIVFLVLGIIALWRWW